MNNKKGIWKGKDIAKHIIEGDEIDIQPNGIEMGFSEIYRIPDDATFRMLEESRELDKDKVKMKPFNEDKSLYQLPKGVYEVRIANKVKIPHDAVGMVFLRSSFNRNGISMFPTALWDSGYEGYGTLTIQVHIERLIVPKNMNMFQICFIDADEVKEGYDGHWQGETKIPNETEELFENIDEQIEEAKKTDGLNPTKEYETMIPPEIERWDEANKIVEWKVVKYPDEISRKVTEEKCVEELMRFYERRICNLEKEIEELKKGTQDLVKHVKTLKMKLAEEKGLFVSVEEDAEL